MSAGVTLSCDGHRHGQPCRGALHTRDLTTFGARLNAADWRSVYDAAADRWLDLCPSAGHDEDQPPAEWHDGPQGGPVVADPLSGLLAPWPPRHADDRPPP